MINIDTKTAIGKYLFYTINTEASANVATLSQCCFQRMLCRRQTLTRSLRFVDKPHCMAVVLFVEKINRRIWFVATFDMERFTAEYTLPDVLLDRPLLQ